MRVKSTGESSTNSPALSNVSGPITSTSAFFPVIYFSESFKLAKYLFELEKSTFQTVTKSNKWKSDIVQQTIPLQFISHWTKHFMPG